MKKLWKQETYNLQVMLFVLIQPLVDIYRTLVGNQFQIMGLSIVELVNICLVAYLFLLGLWHLKSKKKIIGIFAYFAIVGVYFIFHAMNILKFDTSIITNTDVNVFKEAWYILRSYILPIMSLIIFVIAKDEENKFYKIVTYLGLFMSFVIIITNLLTISYISYASGLPNDATISYNMFYWFTSGNLGEVTELTSKGWFYSGNQVGVIMFMMYPVICFNFIKEKKWMNYLAIASVPLAMMMIGTKTAAYGCLVILILEIIFILVFDLILKKHPFKLSTILILSIVCVGSYALLLKSPVVLMQQQQETSYERDEDAEQLIADSDLGDEGGRVNVKVLSYFLNDMPGAFGVHKDYVALYPVEQNPDFWYSVVTDQSMRQVDFRDFKLRIYNEVKNDNNNAMDTWLGIGYTTNFPYIEQDIISQYAWLGVIGVILFIGPFFMTLLYVGIRILMDMKHKMTMENCVLGLSVCCGFAVSIIAGHLFGYVFPAFIMSYILAKLYRNVAGKGEYHEKI